MKSEEFLWDDKTKGRGNGDGAYELLGFKGDQGDGVGGFVCCNEKIPTDEKIPWARAVGGKVFLERKRSVGKMQKGNGIVPAVGNEEPIPHAADGRGGAFTVKGGGEGGDRR